MRFTQSYTTSSEELASCQVCFWISRNSTQSSLYHLRLQQLVYNHRIPFYFPLSHELTYPGNPMLVRFAEDWRVTLLT